MLLLFVLDYVVMAPLGDDDPPFNTVILSIASFVIATLFLIVHVQFGTAVQTGALDASAWAWIWLAFWLLHAAIAGWCMLLLIMTRSLFRDDPPPADEKVRQYRGLLGWDLVELAAQALIIWIIAYFLMASLGEHWKFSVASVLAIVGWFVRRKFTLHLEDKHKIWK